MLIYAPAIAALAIKIYLLYLYRDSTAKPVLVKTFIGLLAIQTIASSIELVSLYYGSVLPLPFFALFFLKIYYVTLFWLLTFLLQISILVVHEGLSRKIGLAIYLIATTMTAIMLFSDWIIIGAKPIGYTVTRIPGVHYWTMPVYGFVLSTLSIGAFVYGYRTLENQFDRLRCFYFLLAICSLTFPILIAVVIMMLDVQMNAAVILPIGTSLFLIIVGYALGNHKLYDIRIWVPFTQTFRLDMARHREFFISPDGSEMLARERRAQHEKRYLVRALTMSDGNQKQAAKRLGISESAVSSKRKQYRI